MKFSPRNDRITLLHEDSAARLACWWKAFLLAPPWLIPFVPAIGGLLHTCDLDVAGFAALIIFVIWYFWLDLLKKKVVLDRQFITHGLSRLPAGTISSIEIGRDRLRLPTQILIRAGEKSMRLKIKRLSGDSIRTLVNTLQRMSPGCRIEPAIDELIKYKNSRTLSAILEQGSTIYVPYHVDRDWENIPETFTRMTLSWSSFIGPAGLMILCFPLTATALMVFYQAPFANWGVPEQHRTFYMWLVDLVNHWARFQADYVFNGLPVLINLIDQQLVVIPTLIVCGVIAFSLARAMLSANRVTMSDKEISLDRWNYFFSYNIASIDWLSLQQIKLNTEQNRQRMIFESNSGKTLSLELAAIDDRDKSRLLKAIRRFGTTCEISAEVYDLLEPQTEKSYTQLWLQSITQAPQSGNLNPINKGTVLEGGRYEVIRRLGVGGLGSAYLAHDLSTSIVPAPQVALKEMIIPPYLAGSIKKTMIERFYAEADILRDIDSPHVVKLIDVFVDERGAYLVLEHIEGKTLRGLVEEQGALSREQIEQLIPQMLSILELLHAKEIVHRDFTPDNLILRTDGVLKLIDFNVAQEESEGTTATIVGKHAYVPPEQFRGKPCPQSDLYAMGATLFYLIAAEDPEPITQSVLSEEQSLKHPDLGKLVESCTATELEERVSSVQQLIGMYSARQRVSETSALEQMQEGGSIINIEIAAEKLKVHSKRTALG